jgi:hypothetical protein
MHHPRIRYCKAVSYHGEHGIDIPDEEEPGESGGKTDGYPS